MKVILQRDIARLGQRGEIKEVSDGYAVNVLIKKGDALRATPAELAKWKQRQDAKAHKKELESSVFARLIESLKNANLTITGKKADDKGQLFASIKETDIADAIFAHVNLSVDPKQIHIPSPIKHKGVHDVTLASGAKKETIQVTVA